MPEKFLVEVDFAGYSRGTITYLVDAESPEEALDNYWCGREVSRDIVRDDTEKGEPRIVPFYQLMVGNNEA